MIVFIDDHHEAHGVEPICKVLPIAMSTYYDHVARRRDPARLAARAKRDMALKVEASSKRISVSTACARCGGNCSGKASMPLAALLGG